MDAESHWSGRTHLNLVLFSIAHQHTSAAFLSTFLVPSDLHVGPPHLSFVTIRGISCVDTNTAVDDTNTPRFLHKTSQRLFDVKSAAISTSAQEIKKKREKYVEV